MNLADRRRRACEAMAEAGADVLVAASTGFHMIDLPNPVAHLSGYRSLGPSLLVLERDGATTLIATPAADAERVSLCRPADAVRVCDDLLAAATGSLRPPKRRVALMGFGALPHRLARQLREMAGARAIDLDEVVYAATGAKTDGEIAAARKATAIAEAGYAELRRLARPGLRECDLAVALNLHMRELGANDSFLMLSAGPRSEAVMPSSERPLQAGDLILVELSPSVDGQFVQICRTVSVGPPPAATADSYALLAAALQEGIGRVRPGTRVGEVCTAIDDHLSAAGYAKFSRPPFIRRRGHGLGAGSTFPGDIAIDNETVLSEGMLFVVHPNQFLPDTGYMMCGEPVIVGAAGPKPLTARPARLDTAELH